MAENALKEARRQQSLRNEFNEYKNAGYVLLQNGKIDEKTYYKKVRDKGISLGLIDKRDYPGRLPPIAEGFLQVLGGTAGAIGGAVVGGLPGAAVGAGVGSGSASLAADFLGDLIAPNMPAPSAEERLKDAATIAAVDTALTTAVPIAGKALKPAVTKVIDKITSTKEALKKQGPSGEAQIGFLERTLGLTDEAAERAKKLADEGIPLSLGQATSSPGVRGIYRLTSPMPIAGAPGQKQLQQTFEAVDTALKQRISPSGRLKPITETERSELIKEFGLESFNKWRNSYKSVYKRAEQKMKEQGDFFNVEPLRRVAQRNLPKSVFEKMPEDVKDLMLDINLYGDFFVATKRGLKKNVLNSDDITALDFRLKDLSKKYDPAKSATPNNIAYKAVTGMQDEMKRQLRNPNTEYGRLMSAGDRLFKEYMSVVEGKTGKEFQKALGRGALRPGVGRPPSQRLEDLYSKTFSDAKSPESVKELKNLIGVERVNTLAANYLDDVFNKYISKEKRDFEKLFNELGFNNLKSKKFEATKELLKDYKSAIRNVKTGKLEMKSVSANDLYEFLKLLKEFPDALPDVSTFMLRSGTLRAAQALGPSTIVGTAGLSAGGGVGAIAGLGLLRALNTFLAQPFNKKLLAETYGASKEKKAAFMRRFLDSLPELPDVPASAIAVQPAVPFVSEEIQK